jgi:hypothetical protein
LALLLLLFAAAAVAGCCCSLLLPCHSRLPQQLAALLQVALAALIGAQALYHASEGWRQHMHGRWGMSGWFLRWVAVKKARACIQLAAVVMSGGWRMLQGSKHTAAAAAALAAAP